MKYISFLILFFSVSIIKLQGQSEALILVKDVFDNDVSYAYPNGITAFGNKVVFIGNDGINGREPWVSDGTETGTFMLKDIFPGSTSSMPNTPTETNGYQNKYFIPLNGEMLFEATSDIYGRELWATDGTQAGTHIVKDIAPGTLVSGAYNRLIYNDRLYFNASPGANGVDKMWVTDGTEAGTQPFADITIRHHVSAILDGKLYFNADSTGYGAELWVTDGTEAGTRIVKDIAPGIFPTNPKDITAFGNKLIFSGEGPESGYEPFVSDGTSEGTHLLKDIVPGMTPFGSGQGSYPRYFFNFNDRVFFSANDGGIAGEELWVSDGTEAGTYQFLEINPGPADGDPIDFTEFDSRLWFGAGYPDSKLWVSDGTEAGTSLFVDEAVNNLTVFNNKLYFFADGGLGVTDGTVAGTYIIGGNIGTAQPAVIAIIANETRVFVVAKLNEATGFELYVVENSTSITNSKVNEFSLYPNPAVDVVNLNLEKPFYTQMPVSISDISGRVLIYSQLGASQSSIQLNTSTLSKGIYIVEVGGLSKKFIKI
jgi:ELWxxDGT repeat protein